MLKKFFAVITCSLLLTSNLTTAFALRISSKMPVEVEYGSVISSTDAILFL